MALPIHLGGTHWERLHPPLLAPGTYAVDPEPYGPPWRLWEDVGEQEAVERGYFVPRYSLSYGPSDTILLAPGDTRGTALISGRLDGYCMGIDGRDGPNLSCAGCGREVGYRIDDCGAWQVVRLLPQALVRLPGPAERPVLGWAEALEGGGPGRDLSEYRDIPAGVALAHLVAAAGGRPVDPAAGPVANLFGRALAALLPSREGALRADVAGPGLGGGGLGFAAVSCFCSEAGQGDQGRGVSPLRRFPVEVFGSLRVAGALAYVGQGLEGHRVAGVGGLAGNGQAAVRAADGVQQLGHPDEGVGVAAGGLVVQGEGSRHVPSAPVVLGDVRQCQGVVVEVGLPGQGLGAGVVSGCFTGLRQSIIPRRSTDR
ncbi:hypothetical protein [Kitasatospora sp. KL5]|uniref:hypothetical protein n=1 Tax=Kitasatospora sp. KL5 TaxID=3425125 RepID=UPI003D6EEA30